MIESKAGSLRDTKQGFVGELGLHARATKNEFR